MKRYEFIRNTAMDLWREMIGYEENPIKSTAEMHNILKEHAMVLSYSLEAVNGFYDKLSIVMKNGDRFEREFFNY